MLSGSSVIEGVKHLIAVLLIYMPMLTPNLPNLHSIPYYPSEFFKVGVGSQNSEFSSAITKISAIFPT